MTAAAGRARVGVALEPGAVTAVLREGAGRHRVWTRALDLGAGADRAAALEAAFAALRDETGAGGALDVAILPPLAEVKRIEFPRLADDELRAVVRRDVRRHFLGAREPQAVALERLGAPAPGRVAVLAAAAPESLVEAVHAAAAASGWTLGSVVPAQAAWTAAGAALWPSAVTGDGRLLLPVNAHVESLECWKGRLVGVRRFPAAPEAWEVDGDGPAGLAGPHEWRVAAASVLEAAGTSAVEPRRDPGLADSPAALAAAYAGGGALRLLPERLVSVVDIRARRVAVGIGIAAAVLLLVAGVLESWGARRELAQVQARRAELRPSVTEVDSARRTLEGLSTRFATLAALEAGAPAWPVVIAGIAEHLPRDAFLTAFRAEGDSIVMEGQAPRASRVFDALRTVPGLTGLRVAAPVRRDFPEGSAAVERFVLSARLGASAAPPRLPAQASPTAGPGGSGSGESASAAGSGATEPAGPTESTGSAGSTGTGAPR